MNIKLRSRITGLFAATALLVGVGLVGLANQAGATAKAEVAAAPGVSITAAVADITGTWALTTDWDCDGSITGSFTQTFNANGTWTSAPFIHNGRWYQVGGMVVWTFADVPNLVYAANLSGSWVSGVQGYEQPAGMSGCFGGRRAGVPKAGAKPVGADPALNR